MKKEEMYKRIEKHGKDLNRIFKTGIDPITLCKKLRRIEVKANFEAVRYCNGDIDGDQWEIFEEKTLTQVNKLLNNKKVPVFINGDPRGYTLKIRDGYVRDNNISIYRDWGGYGIIAPDFREG